MKWLLRPLFAALLLSAITTQAMRISHRPPRDDATSLANGLARLGGQVSGTDASDQLEASFPPCREPVTATLVGFDGANRQSMDEHHAGDASARYVYLGTVKATLELTQIAMHWAAASALAVFGLHAPVPAGLVLVRLPLACPDLAAKDWSILLP